MCDIENDDLEMEIGFYQYKPVEPIELSTPELPWKEDWYNVMPRDADFLYNTSGPGDTEDMFPRSTENGNRTRMRRREKDFD